MHTYTHTYMIHTYYRKELWEREALKEGTAQKAREPTLARDANYEREKSLRAAAGNILKCLVCMCMYVCTCVCVCVCVCGYVCMYVCTLARDANYDRDKSLRAA